MTKRVLVVEDNELNLKLFCDLLLAHGFEPHAVRDAREAISDARTVNPDLIIMDIQMPHISGLELIEAIRTDALLRHTPIMAVTAYAGKGDEERIREAGADAFVSKPITLARFMETAQDLIARAALAVPH
ncbi:MAG: hypothetical protein RIQ68_1444 [Pseudomonadota bacterium]